MYTRNLSELIRRTCVVVMVIAMVVVNSNSNIIFRNTRHTTEMIARNIQAVNTSVAKHIFLNTPSSRAEAVTKIVTPLVTPMIKQSSSAVTIEESIPDAIAPVQVETIIADPVNETIEVLPIEVEEPVISEPVIVSIEDPVPGEIDITSTYNFSTVPLSDELIKATINHCEKFGIPIPIALGLMDVESNFVTTAGSQSGCYGLMQLNHKYFNVYTDPAQQIHDGLEYLSSNLEKCNGDMMLALNIYNAGHITSNMSYSNKVMNDAAKWSEITGAPMI